MVQNEQGRPVLKILESSTKRSPILEHVHYSNWDVSSCHYALVWRSNRSFHFQKFSSLQCSVVLNFLAERQESYNATKYTFESIGKH